MAETTPLPTSSGTSYMLNGTFFWERLISDEGIVSIRVLSPVAFWSILIAAEAILYLLFPFSDWLHPYSDPALGIHTWNEKQCEEGSRFGDSRATRPSAHGRQVGRNRFRQG